MALPAEPDKVGRQTYVIGSSLWQLGRHSSRWHQAQRHGAYLLLV